MDYSLLIEMSRGSYDKYHEILKNIKHKKQLEKFNDTYKSNINKVIADLKSINVSYNSSCVKDLALESVMSKATGAFSIIDHDLASRIHYIFNDVKYIADDKISIGESFEIGQALATHRITGAVFKMPMYVTGPMFFSQISCYFLAHEYVHGLKEIGEDEIITHYTTSESIPIFCEFLFSYNNGGNEHLIQTFGVRKAMMDDVSSIYKAGVRFIRDYKESKIFYEEDVYKDVYAYTMQASMYLNSFYYAVSLFDLYLSNPDIVINLVRHILYNDISTYDLINLVKQEFNFDSLYDNGIKYFSK